MHVERWGRKSFNSILHKIWRKVKEKNKRPTKPLGQKGKRIITVKKRREGQGAICFCPQAAAEERKKKGRL